MAKAFTKQTLRLQSRTKGFDSLDSKKQRGRKRPGSMNPRKGSFTRARRG